MRNKISIALFSFLLLTSCSSTTDSSLSVTQIKCNGFENPVGTDSKPDFSWILNSGKRGEIQTAYQILVSPDKNSLKKNVGDTWDSGKIQSGKSAWISYGGAPLLPGEKYFWQVRVWDGNDSPSSWSNTNLFVTALFEKNDWDGAKWIGYEEIPDSLLLVPGVHGDGNNLGAVANKRMTVPLFRKEFSLGKKITRAFVFVCGLGQYELYINGEKIGDHFLSPGWSDYRKTCFYNTFDVTGNLRAGMNSLGAIVGNGFL